MAKATGYVLRLTPDRAEELLEGADEYGSFPEAVPDFEHSRSAPLTCLVCVGGGAITHVAAARRGMRAAVGVRRLNVGPMVELTTPIRRRALLDAVPPRYRRHLAKRLKKGGLVPPATFAAAATALMDLAPDVRFALNRFSADRRQRLAKLSRKERRSLALQKDALATAMTIAGIDRSPLQDWEPPIEGERTISFLDGLPQMREREDLMVVTDHGRVPGFDRVRDAAHGAAVFENERVSLTVIMANHLPLEEQLGADLIYFNETFRSFVIVQYKAMEGDDEDGSVFRLPDQQLTVEVQRMEHHLQQLRGCQTNNTRQGYRMLENPFFLKLCPRVQLSPDSKALVKGMYLTLDYWKLIEADRTMTGSRGGRVVTYRNVGRYIDNSDFVTLVANAWVGTTVEQSAALVDLVREVLISGRTLTFAIRSDKRPPEDAEGSVATEDWSRQDDEEPPLTVSNG